MNNNPTTAITTQMTTDIVINLFIGDAANVQVKDWLVSRADAAQLKIQVHKRYRTEAV